MLPSTGVPTVVEYSCSLVAMEWFPTWLLDAADPAEWYQVAQLSTSCSSAVAVRFSA